LLKQLKEGSKLEELKRKYPDSEQAIISTILLKAVHESIERNKVIELSF
jgi:Mor family transcriptional regulator